MNVTRILYPKGRSNQPRSYLPGLGSREINLRLEFDELVYGGATSIPHGRAILVRRARRDPEGAVKKCVCTTGVTAESDTEKSCEYCKGEGFYWDENFETAYAMYVGPDGGMANRFTRLGGGNVRVDYRVFFLRYDTHITYADKIIDLKLDEDGAPVVPYKRESIYKPQTIINYRSDAGRIEYKAIYCREEDAIRTDD